MVRNLVGRSALVTLLVACTFLFGGMTYRALPREAAPDVQIPKIIVVTPYIGVSPADIESLVTIPLESELASIKDIKKMESTSAEGASMITLEFAPEVVIEDALQRVRDRVNRGRSRLPDDVEESDIREVSFSDFPIMLVTIAGPLDEERLKGLGEALADDIKRVSGVLDATVSGGRERQIRIQIDPFRLQHYSLSLDDVSSAIGNENVNIPGGTVRSGDASYLLRVPGEISKAHEIEAIAIKRVGERPVFVRDVARVVDGFADRATYARMNGEDAVSIAVTKRSGANILEIAQAVKRNAAERSRGWPAGVKFRVLGDQSKMIEDMVAELENGIITALILVVGVLLFFMGVRNSLFVALSIPLSMLLGMLVISAFGMTLNMIVLFSLILALGMLVDNAIVLVENVYRHVELGEDLVTAAVEGTREVGMAIAASTATTVAAFVPLVFWTGMMGQFMGYMPKTVVIVLIASLVVAVVVLPPLTAKMMKAVKRPEGAAAAPSRAVRMYRGLLEWSIHHRYASAFAGFATLILTFVVYARFNHGTEFFPETEPNRATLFIRAPDGTDLEATDLIVRRIEASLRREENIDVYVAETGVGGGMDPLAAASASANRGRITIDFLPSPATAKPGEKLRVEPTQTTIDRIRDAVAEIPGAEISLEKERMGPPVGKPVAVEVSGEDFDKVGELAALMRRELSAIEGVTDLGDDYRVGRPELRLRIDRGAAKRVGASTRAIASTVRSAVAGSVASTLRDGEEDHDIIVELAPERRQDLQSILTLRVPGRNDRSPDTYPVPISTVASYVLAGGSGSIRHVDQKLVVTIGGDVAEGQNENAVRTRVIDYLEKRSLPAGFAARLGGANDEQRNAQAFLQTAFLVGLFLIALVLVAEFNSFLTPMIIMASVILSLIGVLWGLLLTGTSFGVMMTGLGVISLAGVVVNNAIVLLEYVEQLRAAGTNSFDALVQAGLTRFRPVLLTAGTTVLGLVPMALGISIDFQKMSVTTGSPTTQWWGPMAIAVIFGLVVATGLTLVMVPTLYSIVEDLRALLRRVGARIFAPNA